MTDPNIPPPEREGRQTPTPAAPSTAKGGGGAVLAFIVGGLIVAVAVIGWLLYTGARPAAPEPPEVKLDLHVPAPRLPHVPDRPSPPELPRPVEPPSVTASAPTPAPET